jgi:hypothetical protein
MSVFLLNAMTPVLHKRAVSVKKLNVLDGVYINGVDVVQGLDNYNSEAEYLDVMRYFCHQTPPMLEKLRSITKVGGFFKSPVKRISLSGYAVIMHGIKGSCMGISAGYIASLAERLVKDAMQGDYEQVKAKTLPFIASMESLVNDLQNVLNTVV